MEQNGNVSFNQQLRDRTFTFSISIRNMFGTKKISVLDRSLVNQILRSSSSVAANFRSATRGRSDAEFYAKICIVAEEIDETQFWLEYLIHTGILTAVESLKEKEEADELVRIFTAIKKKMRDRLKK